MFRLPIFTVLALLTVHGANPSVGDDRLPTPIEEAVEKADAAEVKRLLAIDPESVKKTFGDDGTLLHVAVVLGHKEIAELLLAKGADPNAANADGHTALHQAAEYGRLEIANMLVEKGASVSAGKDRGCTPLHIAVMNGWVEVAAWLIEHGSPLGVENQRGQSELHFAVHCRNAAEMIKLLATKGANVNHRDCDGYSPLHLSLLGENAVATVATLLTAGADPNARNKAGNTPLCRTLGSTAMVELLLDNGAEVNGLIPPGRSALDIARDQKVVQLLVKRGAAKTQPLQEACQQGDLAEATRLLDKYPAFVDSAVGASPRTLLHDAAASGNVPLAELLISKGANLDARDWSKWTPLHVAAERGKADLAALLIAKGATIDAPEQGKQTPLHLAARHGTAGLVELLLKNGAEVNAEAADGRTPLHDAVWSRQKDSAKHLIDAGADLTARTETGWKGSTPLHLAVRFADREIVELLLSAGAPVDAQDENEETPLDVATKRKRKDGVVELLREATAAPRTEGQESTRDKGAGRGTVTVERSIANEQLPSTPWAEVAAIETTIHEMKALLVTDGRQHYIAELKRMRKRYKAHPSVPIILLALGEIHESSPEVAIAYYTQAIDYPLSDRLGKYREKSCHRLAAVHEAQRRYDKAIGVLQTMGGPWGPRVAALREKRRFTIWRLQLNRKDKKEEVFKEAWKTIPEILSGENRIPGEILAAYLRPLYSSEDLPRLKDDLKQAEAWIQETESTEADAHIAAEMTSVVQTIRSRLALEERINTASADAMVGLLNDPGIGNTTIRGGLFECDFHEYHWCDKLLLAAVLRHGPAILPKLIELDRNKPNSVACAAIGRLGGKEAVAYLLERASAAGEWADAEHEANYYFALLLTEDEQARAAVLRAAHSGNQKALRQIAAFGASVVLAGMMEQEGAEEDARALEPVRATNDAPLKETPITPDYAMAETLAKAMADTEPGGLFKFGERVANNGAEFLPGLVALVQKGDGWIHDEPGLRQWQYAAYLLGQIGDERCGPVLATRLTDKLATSYYLVKPLGQLRVREAVPYLVRWLKEDNEKRWEVRSSLYGAQANYMIEALEQITGEDFSPGIGPSGHVERYVKKRQEIQSAIDDWWTRAGQREYSQRVDGGKQNAASNSPRKVDASDPSVDAPSCRKRRLAVTLRPDPDRSAAYLMGEYVELYLVEDERVVQFLAPLAPAAARGPVAFTPGKDKTEVWLFEGEKIERYVVPRGPPLLPLPPTEPGQPAPDPPYTKAKSLAGSFTLTNLPKRMSFRYGGVTELTVKELTFPSGAVVSAGPLKLTLRALPP